MTFPGIRTWRLGVKSLLLHPMRSLLTVLGIFIGVSSVIWLLAIGEGISAKAQQQIADLGATNVIVRSIKPPPEALSSNMRLPEFGLKRADYEALTQTIPTVERALPIRELRRQFSYGGRSVDGRLVGCTPEYADVTLLLVDRGHFVSDAELKSKENVCVLAAEVADRLFPFENPLGRSIHVDDAYYRVVGVMKPRNPTAAIGGSLAAQEFSNDVYIPITTLWSRIGDVIITRRSGTFEGENVQLSQVTFRVKDVQDVLPTSDVIRETLERSHKLVDYSLTVPLELLEQARTTRLMFMVFMGLIAAISLVVGGIGIMNIMLATVTERTREIGIRRALGAKRSHITMQFLVETIVLSVVGGLTGILGGLTCGWVTGQAQTLMKWAMPEVVATLPEVIKTVTPVVVPWSIPLAFGISVGVGVIFGLYPAVRAAAMDPVEALRHE